MMDTNAIPSTPEAAAAVQSAAHAWAMVAMGLGAAAAHFYHTVVNAGGVRTIWRNFLGPAQPKQ